MPSDGPRPPTAPRPADGEGSSEVGVSVDEAGPFDEFLGAFERIATGRRLRFAQQDG